MSVRVSQLGEYLVGDVDLRGAVDDALIAGAVKHQLVAAKVGNVLDGIVYLLLNRRHQGCALLEQLTIRSEVFTLQISSLLLFLHDGFLTGFLLLLRKEDNLVLVVLIERLCLYLNSVDLSLPFVANTIPAMNKNLLIIILHSELSVINFLELLSQDKVELASANVR